MDLLMGLLFQDCNHIPLARELLDKPDEFLTVTVENREYSIDHIKPVKTHANIDDGVIHKTLVCEKQVDGNIIR